ERESAPPPLQLRTVPHVVVLPNRWHDQRYSRPTLERATLSVMSTTNVETTALPKRPRLPEELASSTPFLMKRLGFKLKDASTAAYEETGLHPYHHAVLAVLDEGSRETQGAIADALGYDRGQLVGLLDELEERGLVERKRDPADRRRHIVRMPSHGTRALVQLRALP